MAESKGGGHLFALATALMLGLAACSDGGTPERNSAAGTTTSGERPVKGGTLYILSNQDFVHLDPARNWTMRDMGFGTRLLYRTLTTYRAGSAEIVPDLATDLGTPSEGGKVWKFTLKVGVKYEDGTPIKAQDIKYNVERSFSPELPGGPNYAILYLAGGEKYKGPLKGEHLSSIETPDDKTIIFKLKRPVAEFGQTVTLPTFAPVPQAQDKGVDYDSRPFSSGPYKIEKYQRKAELILVRNEHWEPATDDVRKAYPDRIVVKQTVGGGSIDTRLIADQGPDRSAVGYVDVALASLPRVLSNPQVQKRMVSSVDGCTGLLYLNTSRAPFDNPKVRMAVQYAVDKEALQTASGGPQIAEIAGAILPPGLTGGVKRDILRIPPTGDVEKAKSLLAEAGIAGGLKIKLVTSTGGKPGAEALQTALKRVGIDMQIDLVEASAVGGITSDPTKAPDIQIGGWCPDYPSGSTFLPIIFDGRTITENSGGGNNSFFKDKEVMAKIDEINAMTDAEAANKAWLGLEDLIMSKSPAVPYQWAKQNNLFGSNVAGAVGHPIWEGNPDLGVIGLKNPSLSR
ncbi:ABC transporter substrate-binding protein [Nonomuraea roseola]|uniref:ABC transporter substrate-binding protein n=1 Tax=Nonomuraea roseola TaxID=46179 RepID=A0ABV5PSA1_9ACTN